MAIADVAWYVPEHSALDREAYLRGTSVYFPGRVVPMLPPQLSNDLCSLRPDVDRLSMVCRIDITADGEIGKWRFDDAVIRSRARLTYSRVAAYFAGGGEEKTDDALPPDGGLRANLDRLLAVYRVLRKRRAAHGTIDLDLPAPVIELDDNGKVARVTGSRRNDAHRLIEECMLAANICAARQLENRQVNGPFRIHEAPASEKIADLRNVLAGFGLRLRGDDRPEPADFSHLLKQLPDDPARAYMIQMTILRSMTQARYDTESRGHYALGFSHYTHFTSPIRRYPDLLVHRRLRQLAGGRKPPASERFQEVMDHCSHTERRAEEASRDVVAWLKAEFMQDRIGDTFQGTVSAVMHFGLFVLLDECYVDGLVHVTALGNDYFEYDAARMRMTGRRTRRVFQLGDRLEVRIVRVDPEEGKIDFELLS